MGPPPIPPGGGPATLSGRRAAGGAGDGDMNSLTPELIAKYVEEAVPFVHRTGIRSISLEPRRVKMMVPLAGNENHIGSMYAGALFTLAEMPGGAVFLTTFDASVFYPVVKEMNIRYLKPARSDVTIEIAIAADEAERIEKEAREKGKAEFILEGELIDRDGQVVARSHGVYQIRLIGR